MILSTNKVIMDTASNLRLFPSIERLDSIGGQRSHLLDYVHEPGLFFSPGEQSQPATDESAVFHGVPLFGSGVVVGPSRSGKTTLLETLGFKKDIVTQLREPEETGHVMQRTAWVEFCSNLLKGRAAMDSMKDFVYDNDNLIASGLSTSYIPILTPVARQCLERKLCAMFVINLSSGDLKVFKTLWDRLWGSFTYIFMPAPLIQLGCFFMYHRQFYLAEEIILCHADEHTVQAKRVPFDQMAAYVVRSAPFFGIDRATTKDKTMFNAVEAAVELNVRSFDSTWAPLKTVLDTITSERLKKSDFFKSARSQSASGIVNNVNQMYGGSSQTKNKVW